MVLAAHYSHLASGAVDAGMGAVSIRSSGGTGLLS